MKTIVIDNYDSFTYNLVQYLGELGADLEVFRNNRVTVDEIASLEPERIIISPGPGTPQDAGISSAVVEQLGSVVPILGVCLGHQVIGEVFGGEVVRAPEIRHGKTSMVFHEEDSILGGLPIPFEATRYHSLIVSEDGFPKTLKVTAWTENGLIMGLRHTEWDIFGVQFHPESLLTAHGKEILRNFLCCRN
jgi:anthranilate synthase component 2